MLKEFFLSRRIYLELKGIREAQERVANALEHLAVLQRGGRGLASFYNDKEDLNEGEVLNVTDQDFAEYEQLEIERRKAGGEVSLDDPLKGDFR